MLGLFKCDVSCSILAFNFLSFPNRRCYPKGALLEQLTSGNKLWVRKLEVAFERIVYFVDIPIQASLPLL